MSLTGSAVIWKTLLNFLCRQIKKGILWSHTKKCRSAICRLKYPGVTVTTVNSGLLPEIKPLPLCQQYITAAKM